jgi:hypothetical protein
MLKAGRTYAFVVSEPVGSRVAGSLGGPLEFANEDLRLDARALHLSPLFGMGSVLSGYAWNGALHYDTLPNLNVAIAAAASSSSAACQFTDVRDKLLASGLFNSVELVDVVGSTPTLARLLHYDALLTWSNSQFQDAVALGDVLADYFGRRARGRRRALREHALREPAAGRPLAERRPRGDPRGLGHGLGVGEPGRARPAGPPGGAALIANALEFVARRPPEPSVFGYRTAGTTADGCRASIGASGVPSVSSPSGFTLEVTGLPGNKNGILFYGISGPNAAPWGNSTGFLCVAPPTQRTGLQPKSGTVGACDGSLRLDWLDWLKLHPGKLGTPFDAGYGVWAQGWFRDPAAGTGPAGAKGTATSDALHFVTLP